MDTNKDSGFPFFMFLPMWSFWLTWFILYGRGDGKEGRSTSSNRHRLNPKVEIFLFILFVVIGLIGFGFIIYYLYKCCKKTPTQPVNGGHQPVAGAVPVVHAGQHA